MSGKSTRFEGGINSVTLTPRRDNTARRVSIAPPPPQTTLHKIPETIQELSAQQIDAFRQIFELLDSDGGGSIDADEMFSSLKDIDMQVTLDDVNEVLQEIDKSGKGEIDFEEFLQCICSMATGPAAGDKSRDSDVDAGKKKEESIRRQSILLNAITKLAAEHSLGEIMRYYRQFRRADAHVVSHYAAGARVIGLTSRQMKKQFMDLKTNSKNNKSPYAEPLNFVFMNPSTKKSNKKVIGPGTSSSMIIGLSAKRRKSSTTKQSTRPAPPKPRTQDRPTGFHAPHVHTIIEEDEEEFVDEIIPSKPPHCIERKTFMENKDSFDGKWAVRVKEYKPRYRSRNRFGPGLRAFDLNKIQLPAIFYKKKKPMANLTIEDMPEMRQRVAKSTRQYFEKLKNVSVNLEEYSDVLRIGEIQSSKLKENFITVVKAYSPKSSGGRVYSPSIPPYITTNIAPRPKTACV